MVKIITSGRTDVEDFFKKSGNFDGQRLLHTPFLAFIERADGIHVQIIDNVDQLLTLSDETPVMGQWQGDYRSDFFQFTVGEYRPFADEKRKRREQILLSARNVVKNVGPQGGFRSLSFEYTAEAGYTAYSGASTAAEASKLEAFFQEHNIPVIEKREEKLRRNR